jgi:hypothetical protein
MMNGEFCAANRIHDAPFASHQSQFTIGDLPLQRSAWRADDNDIAPPEARSAMERWEESIEARIASAEKMMLTKTRAAARPQAK